MYLLLAITRYSLCLALVAMLTASAPSADPAKVDAAIAKGAAFLKSSHSPRPGYSGGQYGLGSAALCGLAMLEGKVKPDDPAVANIAQYVRSNAPGNTQTYHISLAILFLDRLGDPRDVPLIQLLGVRLYSGLTATGGWGYGSGGPNVPGGVAPPALPAAPFPPQSPVRPPVSGARPNAPKKDDGFPQPKQGDPARPAAEDSPPAKLHPEVARYYLAVRQAIRAGRPPGDGDNSNTQFGLIGLWVAARHGVPAEDAFALIEARFLTTQNPADGGWAYSPVHGQGSTAAMTCAGLLGLAVGQARGKVGQSRTVDPKDANDPFFNPKEGKQVRIPEGGPKPIVAADRKRAIEAGLNAIGSVIRRTAVGAADQPGVAFPGAAGQGLNSFVGLGNEYYLLWSVERVAMAYGLDTIGDADWYDWGCGHLLPTQQANGSWAGASYGEDVNTAFAILFLSRSNFVRDLSRQITGQVKDPGRAELRGTRDRPPLFAPPTEGGSPGPGEQPPADSPPGPTDPPATLPPVKETSDPIADALVAATGADFDVRLQSARDSKGAEHTAGLVRAIPRLDETRQRAAREALAERLTRMTAATLRAMLKDPDAELRRAACLACAMKDDRQHIPDLIERITDRSDLVVRAARAGLKSLTDKDFGPPPVADEEAKSKAQAEWKKWYESQGK
jgi:hypothetical protein